MTEFLRGNKGFVLAAEQTTSISTAATPDTAWAVESVDLKETRPDMELVADDCRASDDFYTIVEGKYLVGPGNIVGKFYPDEYPHTLGVAELLGNTNTVTGSAGVGYTHVHNVPVTNGDFPLYGATYDKNMGGTGNTMNFRETGCYTQFTEYDIPENGPVKVTVGLTGRNETRGDAKQTPTYGGVRPFEGHMMDLKLSITTLGVAASVKVRSAKIRIENGVELVPDHSGSSRYMQGRILGKRKCEIEFTYSQEDSLTIHDYIKNNTSLAVKLELTHDVKAGTSSGYHAFRVWAPNMRMLSAPPELDSSGPLLTTMKMIALYDADEAYPFRIYAVNSKSGTFTV